MSDKSKCNVRSSQRISNSDSRDDWVCIDETVSVPSFIRLFTMRRTLDNKLAKPMLRDDSTFNDIDLDDGKKTIAKHIATRLVRYGIKYYMQEYYNEKEQHEIIELIMCRIIFQKFSNEYKKVIQYTNNKTNTKYQKMVFNTNDIMNKIFQYLEFYHLENCSLVCTHWLYHSWNINSVYHIDCTKLIIHTLRCQENNIIESSVIRMWQRVVNARSLHFYVAYKQSAKYHWDNLCGNGNDSEYNDLVVLNKLSLLRRIERLDVRCKENQVILLETILETCKDRIQKLQIESWMCLSPLKLINVQYLSIRGVQFDIQWTNKCEQLIIDTKATITSEWCDYIIKNCDCTGIKMINLYAVTFEDVNRLLLTKFAEKFRNLQRLKIYFTAECDDCVLFLWTLLKHTIDKNKGAVELKTSYWLKEYSYTLLNNTICNEKLEVNKLHFSVGNDDETIWPQQFKCIQKLIANVTPQSNLEHIKIENLGKNGDQWENVINDFETNYKYSYIKSFDSLKVIEIEDHLNVSTAHSNIKWIIKFLKSNIIFENNLLVITHFKVLSDDVQASFNKILKNIFILLAKQVPIDIKILFKSMEKRMTQYRDCQHKYVDFKKRKFLLEYKPPQCNKFCVGLMKLRASFVLGDGDAQLHVTNVEKIGLHA